MTQETIQQIIQQTTLNPGNQEKPAPSDSQDPTRRAHAASKTEGTPACESPASRYPCRVPIRMTKNERASIGKKACARNLSISRYLVESAAQNKAEGSSDPARLRYLYILFQDAADKTRALLASPLFETKNELNAEVKTRLEEAAYLLKALAGELARRLS